MYAGVFEVSLEMGEPASVCVFVSGGFVGGRGRDGMLLKSDNMHGNQKVLKLLVLMRVLLNTMQGMVSWSITCCMLTCLGSRDIHV